MRVRVELGPRDVHKAQAWLAITTTPGEVAKKSIHQAGLPSTPAIASYLADNVADSLAVNGQSSFCLGTQPVSMQLQ